MAAPIAPPAARPRNGPGMLAAKNRSIGSPYAPRLAHASTAIAGMIQAVAIRDRRGISNAEASHINPSATVASRAHAYGGNPVLPLIQFSNGLTAERTGSSSGTPTKKPAKTRSPNAVNGKSPATSSAHLPSRGSGATQMAVQTSVNRMSRITSGVAIGLSPDASYASHLKSEPAHVPCRCTPPHQWPWQVVLECSPPQGA
jgi:hypothetical protein